MELATRRWNAKKVLLVGLGVFVAAVVVAVAVGFGASRRVTGASMRPALRGGDRVLVDSSAYHKSPPGRFDVVALHPPGGSGLSMKRVIGLPGDRVQIRAVDGQLQVLVQPGGTGGWFIADAHHHVDWGAGCCAADGTSNAGDAVVVPAGKYFVLGDNPAASEDSRKFGFVDGSAIVGRATFRIWPPGGIGGRPKLVPLR